MSKLKPKIYLPGDPEFAESLAIVSELSQTETMKTVTPEDMTGYKHGVIGFAEDEDGVDVVASHAAISKIDHGIALISTVVVDPFFRNRGYATETIAHLAVSAAEKFGDQLEHFIAYVNPNGPKPFDVLGFNEIEERHAPDTGCTSVIAANRGIVLAYAAEVVPIMVPTHV